MAEGPCAGLAVLAAAAADPRLHAYQPLHAARAELLRRAGDAGGADAAYARAIALSANAVERAELERRRAAAAPPSPDRRPPGRRGLADRKPRADPPFPASPLGEIPMGAS